MEKLTFREMPKTIESLPQETLVHICSFLRYRDLVSIGSLNRTLNKVSKEISLWRRIAEAELVKWNSVTGYWPSNSEIGLATHLVRLKLLSEHLIFQKAEFCGQMLWWPSNPPITNKEAVPIAASLIHHGYLTEVNAMRVDNIDLSEVPHASSLADVIVTSGFSMSNVTGNVADIIAKIRCRWISLPDMCLGVPETRALVTAMSNTVREVYLPASMELDCDTLTSYDGRGRCARLHCWGQAWRRYGQQIRGWMENIGWRSSDKMRCFSTINDHYVFNSLGENKITFDEERKNLQDNSRSVEDN